MQAKSFLIGLCVALSAPWLPAQPALGQQLRSVEAEIQASEKDLLALEAQQRAVERKMEQLKLLQVRLLLRQYGLPALAAEEEVIEHQAMMLVYEEAHEQAKWVAHVILPDVVDGNVGRTNDFRRDTAVATGSTEEADYFLKTALADGSFEYDGYGYDRGHLAPSADFRWSATALSESYLYSNMSPQDPELNRGRWAELEGYLRDYLKRNRQSRLLVVTGPVLTPDLPQVERSVNGLSLPEKFFKVVLDLEQQRGIGFLMPNHKLAYPVGTYAVSIDSVEKVSGLDFYVDLPEPVEQAVEAQRSLHFWLPERQQDDVEPILPEDLPPGTYNTVQARFFADRNEAVKICGTVVDTKLTDKGHTFLNLDKKFPDHIFTVAIWRSSAINFSYRPHEALLYQKVCVQGKIELSRGVPTLEAKTEEVIEVME